MFPAFQRKSCSRLFEEKKKSSLNSLQISGGAIWLHMHHTSFERTQLRDKREILQPVISSSGQTYIYIYEWVGFHIYTGCCQRGSFLLTNPEYWNMGYITGGQVYAWKILEASKSLPVLWEVCLSWGQSVKTGRGGWYLKHNQHCNTSKTWDKIRWIWYKRNKISQ